MRRLRQVYTALREQSCSSYAKIATVSGFCDLDIIVIKATSSEDVPISERYVHELLKIFSFSATSFRAFSRSFTRRFGRTKCWRVALKCLILLHRLLRSLPENSPFRTDLMWSRSNGLISLFPCRFQDSSSSSSQDFTKFIHSYARLLDEALDCFTLDSNNSTENNPEVDTFAEKIKEVGRVLETIPQLQSLIDRVIECKPNGSASRSFLVRSAMKYILRDSFICYNAFHGNIMFLLDNLYQMQYRSSIAALGIYKRAAIQASQLSEFHESCKEIGLCGSYEYPAIDKIPHIHVQALECFLNGMWQLTESSSSTSATSSSPTEDENDKQLACVKTVYSSRWERFEDNDDDEKKPVIQLELSENVNWEALLEASAAMPSIPRDNGLYGYDYSYQYPYGQCQQIYGQADGWKMLVYNGCQQRYEDPTDGWKMQVHNEWQQKYEDATDGWKMQVYHNNCLNPFYHPYNVPNTYRLSG